MKGARWVDLLAAALRSRFPTAGVRGGEGYLPASWLSFSFDHGWLYSGATAADYTYGFGHRSVVLSSPAGSASRTVTGTSVTVAYSRHTSFGSLQVFVDGSPLPAATVSTAAGATATIDDGGRVDVIFPSRGGHIVRVAWSSGGDVYLNGLWVRDQDEASGVRVTESGQFGCRTAHWSTIENPNAYVLTRDVAALQPALCVIELGLNDYSGNVPPDTFRSNLLALIGQVAAACSIPPSFLLVGMYQRLGTFTYAWQDYITVMREVADTRSDTTFLDLSVSYPGPPGALYYPDNLHPNDAGHAVIANAVLGVIAPPIEPAPAGGWAGLVSVLEEIHEIARSERSQVPVACPNDGEPLVTAGDGGLYCPFDGWRPL